MKRLVIIGGGIAGLSLAYGIREHQKPGQECEVILLERKGRIGGNIKTEKTGGFLIEGGPDCFISEKPWAMELCKRMGLEDELLMTNDARRKTFVLSRGRLHELPEGVILMVPTKLLPLATSSLISIPGKLRMALEFIIPRRKDTGDESLGSFVRRRLGAEALEKIAEPLVAGVHAGDPETMSVKASFPKFVQMEQEHGSLIRGMLKRMALGRKTHKPEADGGRKRVTMFVTLRSGLSTMIDALSERLVKSPNTQIRTNAAVATVAPGDGGYEVRFEDGSTLAADAVAIAAPAYAAGALLDEMDLQLSARLLNIPYVSTATVSIAFKKKDINHPLNGFGFVVPKVEGRRIMAATWTSVKFDYRAPDDSVLMRCFVGGSKNAELVLLNDADMIAMVRQELKDIMGIDAEPVLARVFRWMNSMPQYTIGHEERIEAIEEAVASHSGLFLTGSAYHGIGISDSVRWSEVVAKKALHYMFGG